MAQNKSVERQGRLGTLFVHAENPALPACLNDVRKAAECGNADAQFLLGECYEIGHLVEKNNVEAFTWYFKAAHQNHANAQRELAVMYFTGQLETEDESQAFVWVRKAAVQNDPRSQCYLGWLYFRRASEILECAAWYRKSAENEFALAQYLLAKLYENGNDKVEKDTQQALFWFTRAANQGLPIAIEHLNDLKATEERNSTKPDREDLMKAISCNDAHAVATILDTGLRLDDSTTNGWLYSPTWPPIVYALEIECRHEQDKQCNHRIIELLLGAMSAQSIRNNSHHDLLLIAVKNNKYEAVELLVNQNYNFRKDALKCIIDDEDIIEADALRVVAYLLDHNLDPLPLMPTVTEQWQLKLIEFTARIRPNIEPLIEVSGIVSNMKSAAKNADIGEFEKQFTHLTAALKYIKDEWQGDSLKARLLQQSFSLAFESGSVEIMEVAFRHGDFAITQAIHNPVTCATRSNSPEIVRFLLKYGCSPFERVSEVEFLDVNGKRVEDGTTPIKIAKKRGYREVLAILNRAVENQPMGWLRKHV